MKIGWMVICLVGALGIGYVVSKNLKVPKTTGLINGRLHPCPKTPNCVCCCHDGSKHYIKPLPLTSHSLTQIEQFLSNHYIAKVVQKTPDYLHVVVTTSFFRFKDDLEFSINREKGWIRVRSASRVGYSDGGLNRSRIEALRQFLERNPS